MEKISIAVDGPSAAGKSTISKRVAKILQYVYIDTGAMYRCVAYYIVNQGISIEDEEKIVAVLPNISIQMQADDTILLNGKDVTSLIRTNEISMAASKVSSYQKVRSFLVEQQQVMAKHGGVILDGRDIGTVVLKDAELKIYLVASAKTRAKRRYLENQERGIETSLEEITKEIEQRDYQDSHRKHSPLRKADDAIEIDSSDLSLEEVVEKVLALVKEAKER